MGKEKAGGGGSSLRGGPPGAAFAARSGLRLGPPDSEPGCGGARGPFISRGTGGPSPAAEAAEPRAAPALTAPASSSRPRAHVLPRAWRRRKPGTPARSRARSVRGAERPGLLCTERAGRPGEALEEAPAAPSGSGKPAPAPRPRRGNFHSRRYLVTPRRHPTEGARECECVGRMHAAVR